MVNVAITGLQMMLKFASLRLETEPEAATIHLATPAPTFANVSLQTDEFNFRASSKPNYLHIYQDMFLLRLVFIGELLNDS
jgi:hypothetical protein